MTKMTFLAPLFKVFSIGASLGITFFFGAENVIFVIFCPPFKYEVKCN